jgi:hypothetical protein
MYEYATIREKHPELSIGSTYFSSKITLPVTVLKLQEMDGVEILPHPGYSPDVAPSDYGLFRGMQHFFRGKKFEIVEEVEIACRNFLASKNRDL